MSIHIIRCQGTSRHTETIRIVAYSLQVFAGKLQPTPNTSPRDALTKLFFLGLLEHLQNLRLVVANNGFAIVPIHDLVGSASVARARELQHTTGRWKLSWFCLNSLKASVGLVAPLTMDEMLELPAYSRIVWSWLGVGASSVMFNSNSSLEGLLCAEWSLAWSSVALSDALADNCFRRVATRTEDVEPALWKRVTVSLALFCV